MSAFLWTTIALLGIDSAAKLFLLGAGRELPRTRMGMAIDVVIAMALIAWAAVLLFR